MFHGEEEEMKLRSIPPANRRTSSRLECLSSMRAATRIGMVFVGPAQPRLQDAGPTYIPRVIKSDPSVHQGQEIYQVAFGRLINLMKELAANAASEEEACFWEGEIDRMSKDLQ